MFENKWDKFNRILPEALRGCLLIILSGDAKYVHVIGGNNGIKEVATHTKIDIIEEEEEEVAIEQEAEAMEKEELKRERKNAEKIINNQNQTSPITKLKVDIFL
ncbi:hypothetical protein RFI_08503 [Reticulomyxa filosa]|uniref:Uncharacterized protein n=1 Tax=Reticulomyxa filosa TaxID=46433 RepID=X6NRH2_RETFI|nr:hypothetical protein RFI_08503 [Reticulomyxa filosa]|eukprot:ETO28626.1 hypothetical protein RFI_08503 [Reticulomyxa filosa]